MERVVDPVGETATGTMFEVTTNVQWAIAGIYGLLALASIAVWALRRANPAKDRRELVLRVKSWWVMVVIFSLAIVLSRTVSIVFMGLVSYLALKEYLSLIPTRRADRRVLLCIYLAVPIQYTWVALEWYGMFIVFAPVFMFLLIPMLMALIGPWLTPLTPGQVAPGVSSFAF